MREITKGNIEKAVRQEYKMARKWCRQDFGRCYQMMIDTEDGSIWIDMFLSENEWKMYRSSSIQRLESEYGCGNEAMYIDDAIQKLLGAGWTILN